MCDPGATAGSRFSFGNPLCGEQEIQPPFQLIRIMNPLDIAPMNQRDVAPLLGDHQDHRVTDFTQADGRTMPGPEVLGQGLFLAQGQEGPDLSDSIAPDDGGAVVNRAFLGEDALQHLGQQIRIQGKTSTNIASQLVLVLNHHQRPDATLGESERGLGNEVVTNLARLSGSSQKEPGRVGVNQDLPKLVPEDHDDDQNGDRSDPPEEPAGQHQARGVRRLLKEPEEDQTDRNLKGDGAAQEEEEPMQDEADDENIEEVLPFQ